MVTPTAMMMTEADGICTVAQQHKMSTVYNYGNTNGYRRATIAPTFFILVSGWSEVVIINNNLTPVLKLSLATLCKRTQDKGMMKRQTAR
jgi:hypothetical protein